MNMAPKNKYTLVGRASAGFTLSDMIGLLVILAALPIILLENKQYPTDVIDEVRESRFQQEVEVVGTQPPRTAIVRMKLYGKLRETNGVWEKHQQLEIIRNPDHHYSKAGVPQARQDWEVSFRKLMIKYTEEVHAGQIVELWYVTSVKTLRNGSEVEEVVSAEVRPKTLPVSATSQ